MPAVCVPYKTPSMAELHRDYLDTRSYAMSMAQRLLCGDPEVGLQEKYEAERRKVDDLAQQIVGDPIKGVFFTPRLAKE